MRIKLCNLVLLALLPACASSDVYFAPREGPGSLSPNGLPAATCALTAEGDTVLLGRLRLWAQGSTEGGDPRPSLRVGFELQNLSSTALRFDPAAARLVAVDVEGAAGMQSVEERPAVVEGPTEVAPHTIARGILKFDLPTSVTSTDELLGFTIEWTVREIGDSGRFNDMTSFVRIRTYACRYPQTYWYGGYYRPHW